MTTTAVSEQSKLFGGSFSSPEQELLVACVRRVLTSSGAAQVRRLVTEEIDWCTLRTLAFEHRVVPLVYSTLSTDCSQVVPASTLETLKSNAYANTLQSTYLAGQLLELLDEFAAQDIDVIPFKGPVLASALYGDLSLRQCADLDLLVRERDVERVGTLLTAKAYKRTLELPWEARFERSDHLVGIDLHWRFTRRRWTFPLDFDEAWKCLEAVPLLGTSVRTLSRQATILVYCQNVAKDYWQPDWPRLQRICDLAAFIGRYPTLNWSTVVLQAEQLGSQGVLSFCLLLASNLLGIQLPTEIAQQVKADPQIEEITEIASARFTKGNAVENQMEQRQLLRRHMLVLQVKEHVPFSYSIAAPVLHGLARAYLGS